MRPAHRIRKLISLVACVIVSAAVSAEALTTQIWTNGEVHPWGTALKCNPSGSSTLTSTNGIAVGGLAPVGDYDGDTVLYGPRANTDRQRWNIFKDDTTKAHRFINVASQKCLDGWDQVSGEQIKQYNCETGTQLNQMVYLEYVQPVPECNPEWSTYRLRVGSPSSSLCVTQQRDSRLIFSPCLSNKADPSQNFFIQNGVAGPPTSPPPPQPLSASATFDIDKTNPFKLDGNGFGSTVWPGDNSVEVLYSDLKMTSIRLWVDNFPPSVDNGIGCDAATPTLVTKAWNDFDTREVVSSANLARKYDVQILIIVKRVPAQWNNTNGRLKTQCEGYVGAWWAAAVTRLRNVGVDVKWIELFNEPDYCGDFCLTGPDQYARVVNIVYNELQNRGLGFVKIVGPGTSKLSSPDEWVAACGNCKLSGWGVHPYEYRDDWVGSSAGFRGGFKTLVNQMWNVNSKIPIYALELATAAKSFHGRSWKTYPYTMETWSDTKPYWARIAANMLEIYSAGGSGTYIWESADQEWRSRSDLWGIINSTTGFKKAGFYALQALTPPIPKEALVLTPLSLDSDLATAVFLKAPVLVIAIVNDIDNDKAATVLVRNVRVSSTTPAASIWTANGQDEEIKSSIYVGTAGGLFVSVKTFVDSIVVLTFNLV